MITGQQRLRRELKQETVFVRVVRLARPHCRLLLLLLLLALVGQQEVPARLLLRLCKHQFNGGTTGERGKQNNNNNKSYQQNAGVCLPLVENSHTVVTACRKHLKGLKSSLWEIHSKTQCEPYKRVSLQ